MKEVRKFIPTISQPPISQWSFKRKKRVLSECNTNEWENAYLSHRKEYFEKYHGYGHKTNSEYLDILKRLEKYSYSNL